MKTVYYYICILFLCASCQPNRLDIALELAGENRAELEKVLAHYEDDEKGFQAARFLIENMPRWYSLESSAFDSMRPILAKAADERYISPENAQRCKEVHFYAGEKIYDIQAIKAEYLIENIDWAMKVYREKSWNKHLPFNDFCEYILPYRINNEPLSHWREKYYNYYTHLLDSLYPNGTDIITASQIILRDLEKPKFYFYPSISMPHQPADFLFEHHIGYCRDYCDLAIYALRACGIPVATDEIIYSPEYQHGHSWSVVRDTTGRFISFAFYEYMPSRKRAAKDSRKRGKVFRACYSRQAEPITGITQDKDVPSLFRDRYRRDVTNEYYGENKAQIDIAQNDEKYVYLGVFSPDGWIPIDITMAKGEKATFRNLEPQVIYQPFYQIGHIQRHAGYPFLFMGDSMHCFVPSKTETETVALTRKMGLFRIFRNYLCDSIIGARIEGSMEKNFKNPLLLHEFKDTLHSNYCELTLPENVGRLRYVRYVSPPHKVIDISGLAFYEDSTMKRPLPLKRINSLPSHPHQEVYDAVIDNNILTYFESQDRDCFLAYDLGVPKKIRKIVFNPHNDDNFVWPGDEYELFYNDGAAGWKSLGRQVADERRYVEYEVPRNALLWLRDRTKGREEQVFFIRDGKQVFVTDLPRAKLIGE